ncbi:MAG: hydroxymethylbilane synthase [Nitrospinota bacterium]|nr:hydroxymethylbilane synthase [Nitrospinota bacterium]
MKDKLVIGTRGSLLALTQARLVERELNKIVPTVKIDLKIIKTKGDMLSSSVVEVIDKSFFIKELEDSLLKEEIDIAVHSLKDMPSDLPDGLEIIAVPERDDPYDVLVSKEGDSIRSLSPESKVGTSSLRRSSQLKRYRNDLRVVPIRGNVDTRLEKLARGEVDALILASAGLKRLGKEEEIIEVLSPEIMLPSPAQGALGIEARTGDFFVSECLRPLDHFITRSLVSVERNVMRAVEGGCRVPLAAFAEMRNDKIFLRTLLVSLDGKKIAYSEGLGELSDSEEFGGNLASELLNSGGDEILSNLLEN